MSTLKKNPTSPEGKRMARKSRTWLYLGLITILLAGPFGPRLIKAHRAWTSHQYVFDVPAFEEPPLGPKDEAEARQFDRERAKVEQERERSRREQTSVGHRLYWVFQILMRGE